MYSFPDLVPVCCFMSSSNSCFLTCIQISQEAGEVVWYFHLFQNFPQFVVINIVKGFGIVNKAEVNVFTVFTYPNLAHPSRLNIYAISFKKSFLYLLCSLSSLNVYMYLFIFMPQFYILIPSLFRYWTPTLWPFNSFLRLAV